MRFMIIVKATRDSEAGTLPSEELLTAMGRYNEELARAGILLAGEGLQPRSKGARVRFSGSKRTVFDGPFVETKELIADFWMWKVKSKEKSMPRVKTIPDGMHSVTPHLICAGAADAIEFYKKTFNAVEEVRLSGPLGRLMHAM